MACYCQVRYPSGFGTSMLLHSAPRSLGRKKRTWNFNSRLIFLSSSSAFSGMEPEDRRENPPASPRMFDVFINHRGPDVKISLALPIYNSLQGMGVEAFLDSQEMELGDSFPPAIRNAISSASVQIAIFSKGYATSPWCLAELSLMSQTNSVFIPVFYDVAPSDLRHIEKGVFANAFAEYEKKGRHLDKLKEWKEALHFVSFITGYEFSKHDHDHAELLKNVVSAVLKELQKAKFLDVAKHPVGLDEIVEDFEKHCRQEEIVKIIGIFGMGGSGKTTLAKELFNRKRLEYHGSCFLSDVREASSRSELLSLQTKLLKDLVRENDPPKFQSIDEGTSCIRNRLSRGHQLRFLIVLDDINHTDQLDALLVRDFLPPHSYVIITTRDERVLIRAEINIRYKMKEMNAYHSRELFCWHAFHQSYPANGYENLVQSFVEVCRGSPLSLKVLGGHVFGSTDKQYWKLELDKVRITLDRDIKHKLKISFDGLESEQKQIFMDIACFFIGKEKCMAMRIWEASGWRAEHAIQTLKDKCLIEMVECQIHDQKDEEYGDKLQFRMHDHLRDLGREMADELGTHHRLWHPKHLKSLESKGFQQTLIETKVHSLRCLHSFLDPSTSFVVTYFVGDSNDWGEASTALLWIKLDLNWRKVTSIPSCIPLQNLHCLTIINGYLEKLWLNDAQAPFQLKELVLDAVSLKEFQNSIGMLTQLEYLVLEGGDDPMKIEWKSFSESLRKLSNLRRLVLSDFRSSTGQFSLSNSGMSTVSKPQMSSLGLMVIREGKLVSKVSICGDYCPNLISLHIEFMPDLIQVNITLTTALKCIKLKDCPILKTILWSFDLEKISTLNIMECPQLEELPSLAKLDYLERITIDECGELQSITGIEELGQLKCLHLSKVSGALLNSIQRLQRLPTELTSVIGKAVDGVCSTLNANFFSDLIGAEAINGIDINEKGMLEASLKTPQSLSAIIVCVVIHSYENVGVINIPHSVNEWIESTISKGQWIVTLGVTDPERGVSQLVEMERGQSKEIESNTVRLRAP
ncbi:disease resistance protein Roq1-like [Cryptomeria japonica]|uniref:disease resistance protein Roq1-like n=1 Tax=Cryptomeria japonica TaxID=3369 RepID=UPI0027DA8C48|nr:disease resistance protein Roq1-like [Cryptomeria japonica]